MTVLHDSFTLNNGIRIPKIGFGTWQIPDGELAFNAVADALSSGYRHIDTARAYGNEASVGRAIRDSGLERDDIFVTSKLPAQIKSHDEALVSFETSMAALQLQRLDLYLIHAPWPWNRMGEDFSTHNKALWTAFESLYKSGRVRAIGVSNFEVRDLEAVLNGCELKPMVNQIKFFIGNTQQAVVAFCQQHAIQIEGFSPLASGELLHNPDVLKLAARYGKSVARICIRYVVQRGLVALPKSTHHDRIVQNADVDFEIEARDMTCLDGLTGTVTRHHGPSARR